MGARVEELELRRGEEDLVVTLGKRFSPRRYDDRLRSVSTLVAPHGALLQVLDAQVGEAFHGIKLSQEGAGEVPKIGRRDPG